MEAIVAGHLCLDMTPILDRTGSVYDVREVLAPGKTVAVDGLNVTTGGVVANTGIALTVLGVETRVMGIVGNDLIGQAVLDVLRPHGLDAGVLVVDHERTSYTVVIALPGMDRIFLHDPGANNSFGADDVDYDAVAGARIFHFGYPTLMKRIRADTGQELADMLQRVRSLGTATSLDMTPPDPQSESGQVDWDGLLRRVLPHVDIYMPSAEETLYMLNRPAFDHLNTTPHQSDLLENLDINDVKEMGHTVDGAFTSNSAADRNYALERTRKTIDIANELGADRTVLWLAREGTLCLESKSPVEGVNRILEAVNAILDYDKNIKVLIEPKPNEPIDRSFCPTMGHVMAVSAASDDPSRVGGLLESAHAVLAGLDPANEIAFALAFGKLWSVHLNDQNGLKYDQDKAFGVENLRQAFNQVKVLVENNYGANGEYVGLDVKAMRTQKDEVCYRHLENSIKVFIALEQKARRFDYNFQKQCVASRDYEALEMYVVDLLMHDQQSMAV